MPPFGTDTAARWGSSWKVYILPFIEQDNIFRQWQFNNASGYQNSNNVNLVNRLTIKPYRCPSSPIADFYASSNNNGSIEMMTSYTGNAGSAAATDAITMSECCSGSNNGLVSGSGVLFPNSQVKLTDIADGTSNTILVGEQSDHLRDAANTPIPGPYTAITSQGPHGWTMGCNTSATGAVNIRQFNCTTVRWTINQRGLGDNGANGTGNNTGPNIPFSSGHSGGAMMLMGDGGVRFMTASTSLQTLQWLATRAGGEVISNF
jgi:prepilin-type processing-associated H-X9-DG protein